ncbi:MAG TPA: O-antigen ligase family protein [Gaiellaceae bacterium]|nr:O-antigen ligase family protein [Gaiellaceae bacterium]
MSSAERLEPSAGSGFAVLTRRGLADASLFGAVAAGVAVTTSLFGAFEIGVWAPLGLALVSLAGALLVAGRRPPFYIWVATGAVLALGAWSVASTSWGGLPHEAWLKFDQSVVAAAALLTGSLVTSQPGRRGLVLGAVVTGLSIHAAIVMTRLAIPSHPDDWISGRLVQGPVGYHNGQGLVFALGIPLALYLADGDRLALRLGGGAAAGLMAGGVLLTQSRGSLLAVAVAVVVQVLLTRRASLLIPAFALACALVGLLFALKPVDAALVAGSAGEQVDELRRYLVFTAVAAAAVGLAGAIAHTRLVNRVTVVGLVVLLVGAASVITVHQWSSVSSEGLEVAILPADENPNEAPAGQTRIASLSSNGRHDAWRVAEGMFSEHPLVGAGQGQFARDWTRDRHIQNLYIIQPHSIELELASELGIVGLGLFAVFAGAIVLALVSTSRRSIAAAALGAGIVLVGDASVDWTWSFPAIVATALFVAGAAAGSRRLRIPPARWTAAILGGTFALALALTLPFLADRHVTNAQELMGRGAGGALRQLDSAAKLDPWNPDVLTLEGRLAEGAGNYDLAVRRYREAAVDSQRPWAQEYMQARTLSQAGRPAEARAACERAVAQNPGEKSLYEGPCLYDEAGNAWPVSTRTVPTGAHSAFSSVAVDKGCTACAVATDGADVLAEVPATVPSLNTAYAELPGLTEPGPVRLTDHLRLPAGQPASNSHLAVLQLRDASSALLYEIYVDWHDHAIRFFSPAGGVSDTETRRSTGVELTSGGPERALAVDYVPRDRLEISVDGVPRLVLDHLEGAATGAPAVVRVGIVARTGSDPYDPIRIAHRGVGVAPLAMRVPG